MGQQRRCRDLTNRSKLSRHLRWKMCEQLRMICSAVPNFCWQMAQILTWSPRSRVIRSIFSHWASDSLGSGRSTSPRRMASVNRGSYATTPRSSRSSRSRRSQRAHFKKYSVPLLLLPAPPPLLLLPACSVMVAALVRSVSSELNRPRWLPIASFATRQSSLAVELRCWHRKHFQRRRRGRGCLASPAGLDDDDDDDDNDDGGTDKVVAVA